jgi:1,4-dihydroxy-2-naphthoate octaprenyltransferase
LKDALARFWSFLTRPQTLKVAAILVVVGLSLVFIFSHWQQILIGIGIIFIIGYFIKR